MQEPAALLPAGGQAALPYSHCTRPLLHPAESPHLILVMLSFHFSANYRETEEQTYQGGVPSSEGCEPMHYNHLVHPPLKTPNFGTSDLSAHLP